MLINAGKTKLSVHVKVTLAKQWFEEVCSQGARRASFVQPFEPLHVLICPLAGEGLDGCKQALEKPLSFPK